MKWIFDANGMANKWLYIYITGALFKTIENNCKFNENRHFTQLAMDFYEWPEYETFFLQLEFMWWTCKNSIDWHVSDNNMTWTMTSYLIVRKSHSRCFDDIFYTWNVFAIDFIDRQPGTMIRIHIPSKLCCVDLRTVKFCHLMRQTWVKTSQYPCVISPNPVGQSDNVMKHSKVAFSSICA